MQRLFIPLDIDPHPALAALGGTAAPVLAGVLGSPLNVEVGFGTGAVCESLGAGASGKLTLKKSDALDGDALFTDISMTGSGSGASTRYTFSGRLISDELLAAIGSLNEPLILCGAIAWTKTGEDEVICIPFDFIVHNSPVRDLDSIPAAADARLAWLRSTGIPHLRAVTGLTGGGTTNLDGAVGTLTSDDIGAVFSICIPGETVPLQHWRVRSGTDATNAAGGIVRPTCFHVTTNPLILEQV